MGGFGTNTHMGTPRNPWDLGVHRTPGGSSSGSGVAVAAGLAPVAIGTDTGGSVRLPAAFCGIVGLKVTVGRICTYGVLPLSTTLDTPGPLARSVEDAALIFRALNGPDPRDPQTRLGRPSIRCPRFAAAWRGCGWPFCPAPSVPGSTPRCWRPTIGRRGAGAPRRAHRAAGYRTSRLLRGGPAGSSRPRATAPSVRSSTTRPSRSTPTSARASSRAAGSRARLPGDARAERTSAPSPRRWPADALLTPTTQTAALPIDEVDQRAPRPTSRAGELSRALRPRRAERLHARRPADLAPDPRPPSRRHRAADRLGLRAGDRLEPAPAAGGVRETTCSTS